MIKLTGASTTAEHENNFDISALKKIIEEMKEFEMLPILKYIEAGEKWLELFETHATPAIAPKFNLLGVNIIKSDFLIENHAILRDQYGDIMCTLVLDGNNVFCCDFKRLEGL